MTPVGEKLGSRMMHLVIRRIQVSHGFRLASAGGHTKNLRALHGLKENDAIPAQGAGGTGNWCIANRGGHATLQILFLELPACKEGDRPAVGRPKGAVDQLSSGNEIG